MFRKFMCLGLCAGMTACAGMGGEDASRPSPFDSAYLKAHVVPGKTTESDIAQMFGDPFQKKSFPQMNKDMWVYSNVHMPGQGNKLLSMAGMAVGFIPGAGLLAQAANAGQMVDAQSGPTAAKTMEFEFNSGDGTVKDWFGDVQ
ncbi:hypothetical protein [Paraburkholderia sp. J12]|uniref:hypothetical protein n=1 Tax=Paraburkholderia sp. J12 TaxID=2805432 RepID=UPI002ABDD7F0|nr:hypothetical protein [Paraburkholderia sp. J12]